jgi:hypothetical protein
MALTAAHRNMVLQAMPCEYTMLDKNAIRIDLQLQIPKKDKHPKATKAIVPRVPSSLLSTMFLERKFPEPVYFQTVDCVGLPAFMTPKECRKIVDFAESQGFSMQHRERLLDLYWSDIVDPYFAQAIWNMCGVEWFLRNITVDGMVACGLNDVIRIQKYERGCKFAKHTDQPLRRQDGKVSKYSLRVFLNGKDEQWFDGGFSAFHVPHRLEPVVFEPETGLALLYPQGEKCAVQEEMEVTDGFKYVLRADVLFCRPDARGDDQDQASNA